MRKVLIVAVFIFLPLFVNGQTYSINGISYPIPEAIDLGLPSGNKWANMNIGASSLNEVGGYYGWGDPTGELTNHSYNWRNKELDGAWNSPLFGGINPPRNISGTDMDLATNKLGANWCMPSSDDFKELSDYCTFDKDGSSITVTGPNGNLIILPISGLWCWAGDRPTQYKLLMERASCFWTSSVTFLGPNDSTYWAQFNFPCADYAYTDGVRFFTGYDDLGAYRNDMIPVRAIFKGDNNSGTTFINKIGSRDIVIRTYNGELSVLGIDDNTLILVFNLFGQIVGKGVGLSGKAKIKTKLILGDIALVKLNNKTIRVIMR